MPVDLQAQLHESMNALIALADQRNIDLGLVPTVVLDIAAWGVLSTAVGYAGHRIPVARLDHVGEAAVRT